MSQTYKQNKSNWKDRIAENDSPWMMLIAIAIFIALVSLALKLIAINILPYLTISGAETFKPSNVPIVGWAWDLINIIYLGTGAFIAWALIQIAQVLWILISLDRKAQRTAVRVSQEEHALQGNERVSDRVARKVQRRATRIPFFFMGASGFIALFAYVIEAIVNLKAYPPVKNWSSFIAGLTISDISPIDFGNVAQTCWGLFSTEFVVIALLIVGQWIWSHRQA